MQPMWSSAGAAAAQVFSRGGCHVGAAFVHAWLPPPAAHAAPWPRGHGGLDGTAARPGCARRHRRALWPVHAGLYCPARLVLWCTAGGGRRSRAAGCEEDDHCQQQALQPRVLPRVAAARCRAASRSSPSARWRALPGEHAARAEEAAALAATPAPPRPPRLPAGCPTATWWAWT